jgi:hypothetical protein
LQVDSRCVRNANDRPIVTFCLDDEIHFPFPQSALELELGEEANLAQQPFFGAERRGNDE